MAALSIKQETASQTQRRDSEKSRRLHNAQYDALVAVIAQLAAKLDADATVTDVNYASLAAAVIATKIVA
jgi:hypothetical protein